jgi:hypothetical protein
MATILSAILISRNLLPTWSMDSRAELAVKDYRPARALVVQSAYTLRGANGGPNDCPLSLAEPDQAI